MVPFAADAYDDTNGYLVLLEPKELMPITGPIVIHLQGAAQGEAMVASLPRDYRVLTIVYWISVALWC
jgi:hypothetical protein